MREQPQLASMIKGQVFDGFLLVRQATQRTSKKPSNTCPLIIACSCGCGFMSSPPVSFVLSFSF